MTPFYTMVTAYNGNLYKVNIYSKKVDDLIGPFNYDTGEPNDYIVLQTDEAGNEVRLYSEKTKLKNFTEIIVPVKKLNKHKFLEAVDSQLLYLPNVDFKTVDETGFVRKVDFAATVIYNSENLIISQNAQYSRPHLVVVKDKSSSVGICYNEINYRELELEQRYGQVGLKVQMRAVGKDEDGNEYLIQEGVTVTPNREQVIWNDDTKNYLLSITRKVADEASDIINKQLIEKDFLLWISKASSALSSFNRGSALSELSQMIDKSNIVPTYCEDKSIKFKNPAEMFWGMYPRYIRYENVWQRNGGYVKKVQRDVVDQWSMLAGKHVYLKLEGKASNVKDQYIMQTQVPQGRDYGSFVLLEVDDLDAKLDDLLAKTTPATKADVEDKFNKQRQRRDKILNYLQQSSLFRSYDDVVVPEEFQVAAEEEEVKVAAVEAQESASLEELRKAAGEIVFFTPRPDSYDYRYEEGLIWDKLTYKTTAIAAWTGKTFYGFNEDAEYLQCACRILGRVQSDWFNENIRIVKVARKNEKHFKTVGEHISNFFYQFNDNVITMDQYVQDYYTGRYISKKITENSDMHFLSGHESIDKRAYDIYKGLIARGIHFEQALKIRNGINDMETKLFDQLAKYAEFQRFVFDNKEDSAAIAAKSKELFGSESVKDAQILHWDVVEQVELLEAYAEPVKDLFNSLVTLNHRSYKVSREMSSQEERLIRLILRDTGLDKFDFPDNLVEEKVAKEE